MEINKLILYFYTLILATIYTKCVHSILISAALNSDPIENHKKSNVVAIVYDTTNAVIEYSSEYYDVILLLKSFLTKSKKKLKDTEITKRFKPLNIENISNYAFYEKSKNEIVDFLFFLDDNYKYLFNKYVLSSELDEYNDDLNGARAYFNNIFRSVRTTPEDRVKYFDGYYRIKKYINLSVSIHFELSTGLYILLIQIDPDTKKFNVKFTDYLTKRDINLLETAQQITKENDPVFQNLIKTMSDLRVYRTSGVFDHPERKLEQLCLKHDYGVTSENWISYFHPHNETLCHIDINGNGDCFFYTVKHLLYHNGIEIPNYTPTEHVPETKFVPWYLENVRKYPKQTIFNTIDLRYITTYYTIKYFPGYTKDEDLDSQSIRSMLEILSDLEISNYHLKKHSLVKMLKSNYPFLKILDVGSFFKKKLKSIFKGKDDDDSYKNTDAPQNSQNSSIKNLKTDKKKQTRSSQNSPSIELVDLKHKPKNHQGVLQPPTNLEINSTSEYASNIDYANTPPSTSTSEYATNIDYANTPPSTSKAESDNIIDHIDSAPSTSKAETDNINDYINSAPSASKDDYDRIMDYFDNVKNATKESNRVNATNYELNNPIEYNYDEILEDISGLNNRMYELIFFKLISLKENNITEIKDNSIPIELVPRLKGKLLKSKVLSSHPFKEIPKRGDVFPFFNFSNIKKQLSHPFNLKSYHNNDLYGVVVCTTFNKELIRKSDKKKTYSLIFNLHGDELSYHSILNNDYHFTHNSVLIETKTMHQKALALFYERTRPGHSHWGDETDYNAFQKMFNIGLITFMHDSTKLFFPKMDFEEYPNYFLIYFFSEMHFEPAVHVKYNRNSVTYKSSYERNNIPNSITNIP
ncbi:conserved Plasmodium protein, unknown function [Plasmodium yoelii]|uniref:OTU domain-containing protein n=3 Tax=Plasmodium yoelii TaxID=5861 RepID=A0AAE9WXP6_PLAYO|nr:conserved Plasmodium protein, unknown function [Plasmodium yoelii]WBY60440.1 hypothetical protein Py17XNL_001303520 [Plasmodium yoelii yoelii]CDU20300.1 conserved Plasmodium protein, unknown function [Plasmodium yoelii]VTZ81058.1 conserved Plasmodium protein, unknown function [Plasmodium yoelii]|eukprot:XP_727741.2 conserved Plasmodium protein, unknown function [Plasmodium yoelii]